MAERNALFLSMAQKCAARGEAARAMVTVINALQTNPRFIECKPEAIDFLASIYIAGFEEELGRLESRHPAFGARMRAALLAQGKADLARQVEENFNAYCIKRMKDSAGTSYVVPQSEVISQTMMPARASQPSSLAASRSVMTQAVPCRDADYLGGGSLPLRGYGLTPGRPSAPIPAPSEYIAADSGGGLRPYADYPLAIPGALNRPDAAEASGHGLCAIPPDDRGAVSIALEHKKAASAACEETFFERPVEQNAEISVQSMDQIPDLPIVLPKPAPKRKSSAWQSLKSSDSNHRFDRITVNKIQPETPIYADNAADRVILDFDDCVRETPKSVLFAPSQTKIRSYEEDLAWARESNGQRAVSRRKSAEAANPMELVAETTHALSDTPSVEPYDERHPWRFSVTSHQIIVCVALCMIGVFALVIYQSARPDMEKRAIEGVSSSYIQAAESGASDPLSQISTQDNALLDPQWMQGYRLFLETWQALHFEAVQRLPIDPENGEFPLQNAAAHAAYISQEIADGHFSKARAWFEKYGDQTEIWRDHAYFKLWAEAQIEAVSHRTGSAAVKYEKLIHTPLAPFALSELGFLAIQADEMHSGIRESFLRHMSGDSASHAPGLALCSLAVLERDKTRAAVPNIANLISPYAEYCTIGRVFSRMANGAFGAVGSSLDDARDMALLQVARVSKNVESARIEAMVRAELYNRRPGRAVSYYHQLDLPETHPARLRLRDAILSVALTFGDWSSLHELFGFVPQDISIYGAARIIDSARGNDLKLPGYSESLLKYGAGDMISGRSDIEDAYQIAANGQFDRATDITRALIHAHPDFIEPVLLQAMIMSRQGQAKEAVAIIENHAMPPSAAFIVLGNVYRARANMRLSLTSFILPYVSFEDPVLESARCEVFWRYGDSRASKCIKDLSKRRSSLAKSAWIMNHLESPMARPTGTSAQWAKAGAKNLSFPGYALAYARALMRDGDLKNAMRQYARAILDDPTTSTVAAVEEFEKSFGNRRYEGTKQFEALLETAAQKRISPQVLGAIHLAAAHLYQPKTASSQAKQHLMRALEIYGDRPDILQGFVDYYEAKDKPENAASWRMRLRAAQKLAAQAGGQNPDGKP